MVSEQWDWLTAQTLSLFPQLSTQIDRRYIARMCDVHIHLFLHSFIE